MRVLHLIHRFPPELAGGTQTYVAGLARLQRERGWEPQVLTGSARAEGSPRVERIEHEGTPVSVVLRDLPPEVHSGQLGSARIGALVEEEARRASADLVHVHHWDGLSNDLVRRLRALGLPVVLTLHDLWATCARSFRMPDARTFCAPAVRLSDCARCVQADVGGMELGALEELLAGRFAAFQAELGAASRVLAISTAQKAFLAAIDGFGFSAMDVLPLGIPRERFGPASGWRPVPGRLRVANWAGLDPRKGVHTLLEAVARSDAREALEVNLYGRAGDPAYMEELERLARGSNVRFHGPFDDSERARFARDNDVAAFPFLAFETHGLVVDEALALGLPVLVSDHGAPKERLAGKGFAVVAGDPAGLASALEWLLDQPDELERMRELEAPLPTLEQHERALADVYGQAAG
jgi:glycosyltransferase involved in cell wall biosynthesis